MKPEDIDQNLLHKAETIIRNCLTNHIVQSALRHADRGGPDGSSVNVQNNSKLADALYYLSRDFKGSNQLLIRRTEKDTDPADTYYMYSVTPLGAHVALLLETGRRMGENKDTTETAFMRVMREHDRAKGLLWKEGL